MLRAHESANNAACNSDGGDGDAKRPSELEASPLTAMEPDLAVVQRVFESILNAAATATSAATPEAAADETPVTPASDEAMTTTQ